MQHLNSFKYLRTFDSLAIFNICKESDLVATFECDLEFHTSHKDIHNLLLGFHTRDFYKHFIFY